MTGIYDSGSGRRSVKKPSNNTQGTGTGIYGDSPNQQAVKPTPDATQGVGTGIYLSLIHISEPTRPY